MNDESAITPNDVVALLVEVAALVLLGIWGWRHGTSSVTRPLFAIAVPLTAIVVWGLFAAPKSRFDVLALEVATKVVVLGGAVVVALEVLPRSWGLVFAAVVVVNTALLYIGPWAR